MSNSSPKAVCVCMVCEMRGQPTTEECRGPVGGWLSSFFLLPAESGAATNTHIYKEDTHSHTLTAHRGVISTGFICSALFCSIWITIAVCVRAPTSINKPPNCLIPPLHPVCPISADPNFYFSTRLLSLALPFFIVLSVSFPTLLKHLSVVILSSLILHVLLWNKVQLTISLAVNNAVATI